jgi:cysteine desulfurase
MDEVTLIYLDHCATTPMHPEVVEAMLPYFRDYYGNPSSIHAIGQRAKTALEEARQQVADLIGATAEEIVFTSGGTEADNLAIRGILYGSGKKGNHIITSTIEHHAVLNTCVFMQSRGFDVTCVPVDETGLIDPDNVREAISDTTALVSIMHANNEIGTIEPIAEIASIAKEKGIIFHTDAVQTVGKIPVDVNRLNVDLMALSGHKIYGPKGIGALYIRKGTDIVPLLYGGRQEGGIRHGTENVPAIVGLGKACEIAGRECAVQMDYLKNLRDHLETRILKEVPDVFRNGHPEERLPHVANLSVESIEAESIVRELDKKGIAISAGSACTSDSIEISHVIAALGMPKHRAGGSIRFSLGRDNTTEQMTYVVQILGDVVQKLRGIAELERSLGKRRCV